MKSGDFMSQDYKNIFENKVIREKINFHMDMNQLFAFKELLNNYIGSAGTSFRKRKRKRYLKYLPLDIVNIYLFKYKIIDKDLVTVIKSYCYFEFELEAKSFKWIDIIGYIRKANYTQDELKGVYNALEKIIFLLKEDICTIIENILKAEVISKYWLQNLYIKGRDIIGYYDFEWIDIDGGDKKKYSNYDKIIKCKFKAKGLNVKNLDGTYQEIASTNLYSTILRQLLSVFCRFCEIEARRSDTAKYYSYKDEEKKYGHHELNDKHEGKYHYANRMILTKDETFYKLFGLSYVPQDINELFDIFFRLDFDTQQMFIISCSSYVEALQNFHSQKYTQGIVNLISSIENIATYESVRNDTSNPTQMKAKKIESLFTMIFGTDLKKFLDIIYSIRSKYVHRGISNNKLLDLIFSIQNATDIQFAAVEEVTHFVLIRWLLLQK